MSPLPQPRSHWTPRYLADRAAVALHERRHPADPWLVPAAVDLIGQWLRPGDVVIAWGAGRSTAWFLAHGARVRAVEHHQGWADQVRRDAGTKPLELAVADPDDRDAYVGAHPDLDHVDVALVDGIHRDGCALRALDLVRPGGLLVIDNIERYLPSSSRGPEAIGPGGPADGWEAVAEALAGWRGWWWSSGVTDTAVWVRP